MQVKTDEIADGIYRLSVHVSDIAPPAGFTFNHFLIRADQPMLFHCGLRGMFPALSEAVARLIPVEQLRWIGFGHVEADECGAMNSWLAAAPRAQVVHGATACMVSVNDLADAESNALLFKRDSVHGASPGEVCAHGNDLVIILPADEAWRQPGLFEV